MKHTYTTTTATYMLAATIGALFSLASCSSDEVAQIIADEFVTVSGQITDGTNPIESVAIKGIYSDGNPLNPSTTTAADGTYSLDVLKNDAVSIQAAKSGFATLNSAKEALSADESGFDVEMVSSADAEAAIAAVFPAQTLAGHAWLVVNVVDNSDVEVNGVTISLSTTSSFVDAEATGCDSGPSGDIVTIAPCPTRDGPMYFAYFDSDSTEVTVTAGASSQLAPVRRGEVTFLEFIQ